MAAIYNGFVNLLIITLLFISCQKPNSALSNKELPQKDMMDVSYGTNASQVMDVYLPAGRDTANTKVLLFIHGGSWSGGDKSDFDSAIASIRKSLTDYAIFNISYRLAANGLNRFPAQMEDIQSDINFIESNAGNYKINTSKVVLIGASAGAHLALLQAYKNNSNGKVKAVIDLFGPTDLTSLYNNHPIPAASQPVLVNFLGATPVTNAALYQQASPINFINTQTVPTLIFHGEADYIVPISQSSTLKTKLEAAGVKVSMITYPVEGHGWYGASLADTIEKTIAFIKQNVK
jgi:acetyl esterase/lipase